MQVWGRCEALTAGLSSDLAEQLRLVLEPQLASKMAGEYRTGKRISMKRVIAYIASHFKKDKIWLRRTRADKRKYQASHLGCARMPNCPTLLIPQGVWALLTSASWNAANACVENVSSRQAPERLCWELLLGCSLHSCAEQPVG